MTDIKKLKLLQGQLPATSNKPGFKQIKKLLNVKAIVFINYLQN